jgi:hypothetical protein
MWNAQKKEGEACDLALVQDAEQSAAQNFKLTPARRA